MNVSQRRSAFEAKLSSAHRMAYYAAQEADNLGYRAAVNDLQGVMLVLKQLLEDSLSSNPRALDRLKHITDNVPF